MAKQKKLEKAAKNALDRAKAALADARKRVAKLDSKTKKKAEALSEELTEVEATFAAAEDRAEATASAAAHASSDGSGADGSADTSGGESTAESTASVTADDLTPPLPSVTDDDAAEATEFVGGASTTAPHDPALDRMTVQALRDAAKARGLRNVSRLNKAQLIERLSE
jgi:hypothetical protein